MRRKEDLNDSPLRAFKTREALRGVARDHDRSAAVEVAGAAIATPGKATLTSGLSASTEVLVQLQRTMASAACDATNLEQANRTGDFKRASWAMAGLKRFIAQVPQLLAMVPRGASGDLEGKIAALVQRARTALDAGPTTSDAARRAADRGDFAQWRAEVNAWRAKADPAAIAEPTVDRRPRRDIVSVLGSTCWDKPAAVAKPGTRGEAANSMSANGARQPGDEPVVAAESTVDADADATTTSSSVASSFVESGSSVDSPDVHDVAAQGVADGGGTMPHGDAIARSFGPEFDISGLQAHIGGAAATATTALGAHAYAAGNRIAFASAPDLHTAAHEATHAVLQMRGVAPAGGIGASHDAFERHADAVADAVVAGRTAAPLLARMTGGARVTGSNASARRAAAVQLKEANSPTIGSSGKSSAGDGMWSELAPGERTVAMQLISRVDAFKGVYLRSHPAGDKDGVRLPFGTLVSVSRKTEKGWYYVTVLPEDVVGGGEPSAAPQGATGFVESYHVASAMPEPKARLEKVESGALLKDIAARHYKHNFAWGNDARIYVQAIYHANKNRDAVIRQAADMEVNREALSTTSLSRALELWSQARAISGQALWMPSEAFVQQLKSSGVIHQGSISKAAWDQTVGAAQAGWDSLQYAGGFSVGLLQGAWGSLEDLLNGFPDMIKMLWTVIKDVFSDFAAIQTLAKQMIEAWKNRDAILMRIANDFMDKWEHTNLFIRGNFQGEFLGYVMALALITGLTMGAGAMVVGAGRFGPFVRLIQVADDVGSIGTYVGKVKSKIRLPKGVVEQLRRFLRPAAKIHGDAKGKPIKRPLKDGADERMDKDRKPVKADLPRIDRIREKSRPLTEGSGVKAGGGMVTSGLVTENADGKIVSSKLDYVRTADLSEADLGYKGGLRDPVATNLRADIPTAPVKEVLNIAPVSNVRNGSAGLVRIGELGDGRPVALKSYHSLNGHAADEKFILGEARSAKFYSDLGIGPTFHGTHVDTFGKLNIVTDIATGDFVDAVPKYINHQTFADLETMLGRLKAARIQELGDRFQPLIDDKGRMLAIDSSRITDKIGEKPRCLPDSEEGDFTGQRFALISQADPRVAAKYLAGLRTSNREAYNGLVQYAARQGKKLK